MTMKAARDFVAKAKNSKDIQQAIRANPKDVLKIAHQQGYDFTPTEIHHAMRESNIEKPGGDYYDDDDSDTCCV